MSLYDIDTSENNELSQLVTTSDQPGGTNATPDQTTPNLQPPPLLLLGSDVEIAGLVARQLKRQFGPVPYSEGEFWRYEQTHWEPIPEHELRRRVHKCDGLTWGYEGRRVRLNRNRIDSIINELGVILSELDFFESHRVGINCLSGFISFDEGSPRLLPHDPDHRQRHVLQGRWEPEDLEKLPEGSLLGRLLTGSFLDDPDAKEKSDLIAEISGAAALGHGTRHIAPKALILLGRTAENGKSQVLDLLRGLLPASALSSVPPSKFGDEKYVVTLASKLLNTSDELGTVKAIASDGFKAIITGEPMTARTVYLPVVHFRPQAQHVFACNQLPAFQGGMDRGVLRRLLVMAFNRTIPAEERIPNIGQRIVAEELDLVLAWAVQGAARLLQRGRFPELPSSNEALQEWAKGADPVLGWIEDRINATTLAVVGEGPPRVTTRKAYEDFQRWAVAEGHAAHSLPSVNTFSQRLQAVGPSKGITYKHAGGFRGFVGMRLRASGEAAIRAKLDTA